MKKHLQIASVLLVAAFLAGCQGPCQKISAINGPVLTSGSADFSRYVAAGTSISAGWQSGGLVDRHQIHGFPALFARQIGKTVLQSGGGSFSLPSISADGIPALMKVQSFVPLVISSAGQTQGVPENLTQPTPYGDLGVPGALAFDFADTSDYYAPNPPIYRTDGTMFQLIARHSGTIAQQVLAQQPTFVSWEYGANEVLGSATSGVSTLTFPAASFAAILTGAMNAIHAALPNTKVAIFTVPDVTTIPFFTTFKPGTVDLATGVPTSLIGPGGTPLGPTDLVLLTAQDSLAVGTGFPVGSYNYLTGVPGNGRPLLDAQVLSSGEQTSILTVQGAMNAAIDSVGMRPNVVVVDMAGLLAQAFDSGIVVGNTTYTSAFVTGGLFSLDGVHPNDLAHALLCNAMIDAVNAKFGSTVPRVNPAQYATATASSARPAPGGEARPLRPERIDGLAHSLHALFPWRR